MKKSKINKDFYKYSKTLYGAERFKLILTALRKVDEKGGGEVPRIDTVFQTTAEYKEYKKILVDFLVVNECIRPMLGELHYTFLALMLGANAEVDEEMLIKSLLSTARKYFDVLTVVEELNEEYDIDLFSYHNRKEIDSCSNFFKNQHESISQFLEKNLDRKVLKKMQEDVDAVPRMGEKRANNVIKFFRDATI